MKALAIALREVVKTWWRYRDRAGEYGAFYCLWLTPKQTSAIKLLAALLNLEDADVIPYAMELLVQGSIRALEAALDAPASD